jgi:hypothetical protein
MKRSLMLVAGLVVGLFAALAQAQPTQPADPAQTADVAKQREWAKAMHESKLPKKGCFDAKFPATTWHEIPCKKPPNYPMLPRKGPRPFNIGASNDVTAKAPTGTISQATGSFDAVTGVTSVTSLLGGTTPTNNAYSLQLNTNHFTATAACAGTTNPGGCKGFEQFVFIHDGTKGSVFMQYWLVFYNTTCPATGGWNQVNDPGGPIHCYRNAPMSASTTGAVAFTTLPMMTLSATIVPAGSPDAGDTIKWSNGPLMLAATGDDTLGAGTGWNQVEYNILGACCGDQAVFNSGASIQPRVTINYGGTAAPTCLVGGFSGESNNLSFGPGTPTVSGTGPAMTFIESSAGGATAGCSAAATIGDTHLSTVAGLLYDFQAAGDFVLAEVDPDFVVQVRQVSGAPNWPNASVNKGVAARLGKTTIAVCLGSGEQPTGVFADGKPLELAEGQPRLINDEVTVGRLGNSYIFSSATGDSVRADVNGNLYMNVYLGFASSAANIRGLIANPNDNVNQIAGRDGSVLTSAFDFDALYKKFGDSWRVSAAETLLKPCGKEPDPASPTDAFAPQNLPAETRKNAEAACTKAGVKAGPLFDACTIDVAVIGTDAAATVFATMPPPKAVGEIKRGGGGPGSGSGSGGTTTPPKGKIPWWLWLLLALVIGLVLIWLLMRKKTP